MISRAGDARNHRTDRFIDGPVGRQQFGFMSAPKHVRVLIDLGEIEEQQAIAIAGEDIAKKCSVFLLHHPALFEIFGQGEDALTQCRGVLIDSLSVKGSDAAPRSRGCMQPETRSGSAGSSGIDIQRCPVDADAALQLLRVDAEHACHGGERADAAESERAIHDDHSPCFKMNCWSVDGESRGGVGRRVGDEVELWARGRAGEYWQALHRENDAHRSSAVPARCGRRAPSRAMSSGSSV